MFFIIACGVDKNLRFKQSVNLRLGDDFIEEGFIIVFAVFLTHSSL
jgi:hypothetical protein